MASEKFTIGNYFKKTAKVVFTILLALLMLVGTFFGFQYLKSLKKPPGEREIRELVYKVTVFEADPSRVQQIISGFGTAKADREVVVSAQVAGEVVQTNPRLEVGERMIAHGDSESVSSDLILRIDPTTYEQKVAQAESLLASDRAELARLEREMNNQQEVLDKAQQDLEVYRDQYERIKGLRQRNVAAESELTQAQLELQRYETLLLRAQNEYKLFPIRREQLEKQIDNHEQDLKLAKHNLEQTSVTPPFNAVISEVTVELGEYVNVGRELLKMVDVNVVEVPVSVTTEDYAFLRAQLDNKVYPQVKLAPNETAEARWTGVVVRLSPVMNEQTRTVKAYVQVNNRDQKSPLLPGTFVHARIDGEVLDNVLIVPRDAIQNGQVFVASREPVARPKSPADRDDKNETENPTTANADNAVAEKQPAEPAAELPPVYAVEARSVKVEQTLQSLAVVSSGINPGEAVIMSNLDVIHNGAKIEIFTRRDLTEEIDSQRVRAARQLQTSESAERPPAGESVANDPMKSSRNSPTPGPRQ
ncbi:MAG: hypothetical protein CMJ46_12925 [Planctomyces sp.]|nr:hypothetical protein [Planctomyces sp.]